MTERGGARAVATQRRDEYADLDRDQLIARLAKAEDALVLYGWSPVDTGVSADASERLQALYVLWLDWLELAGTDATDPRRNAHLDDEAIAELGRRRLLDATRARTRDRDES
jgi:hypothetical protein